MPGDKKKKKGNYSSYATYIFKVLRQVNPDTGISKKAMSIMDSFMHDFFEKLAHEASNLALHNKRRTVSTLEIQTAVRLVLSGELAEHGVSEITKATTKFNSSEAERKKGAKASSRAGRAGLQFPVGRIHRMLKDGNYADVRFLFPFCFHFKL